MDDFLLRGTLAFRSCSCLHDNEVVAFAEAEDELTKSLDDLVADVLALGTAGTLCADRMLVLRPHQLHERVNGCFLDLWLLEDVAANIQECVQIQVRKIFQVNVIARLPNHV